MVNDDGVEQRAAAVADLWRFYEEHAAQARQHEDLRGTVTSILTAIAAAVVGPSGLGGLDNSDIPAGLVVVILSGVGVALSIKHYERNRFHSAVLAEARRDIDRLQQGNRAGARSTNEIRDQAKADHEKRFSILARSKPRKRQSLSPWPSKVRLHLLWLGLPLGIGIIGCAMVVVGAVIGVSVR